MVLDKSTLVDAVSKWWHGHFESFQILDDFDEEDFSFHCVLANRLAKEVQLLDINHGMKTMNVDVSTATSVTTQQTAVSVLTDIWIESYIPACLAVEGNEEIQVAKRLLGIMMALSRALKISNGPLLDLAKKVSLAAKDSVRAFGCHMLGFLGEVETLIPRLTDKAISVRASAIVASSIILQSSTGEEELSNDLLEAVLWNVWHETSVPNRVLALQALPMIEEVWDHVIARLRDVKEKVRLAAVRLLWKAKKLTSTQLTEIVQNGIGNLNSQAGPRCQLTKDAIVELICSHWIKQAKFNALTLIDSMNVLENEDECEQVIRVILNVTNEPKDFLSSLSPPEQRAFQTCIANQVVSLKEENFDFSPGQYLLTRVAAAQDESLLNKAVSDIDVLCDSFQHFSVADGEEGLFKCLQLVQIATVVGGTEEGSRRRFTALLQAITSTSPSANMPDELLEASVKALVVLHSGSTDPFNKIISHLRGIAAENTDLARPCSLRILSILSIVLEEAKVSFAMSDFLRDVSGIVEDAVGSDNDILKEAGVACMAKVGLFTDKDIVLRDLKPLMMDIATQTDNALTIRSQALMALTDWALIFEEILQVTEKGLSFVDHVLLDLLSSKNYSVVAIAAEASVKLLFAGRICESSLIAHLLNLFFDPKAQSIKEESTEIGSASRMQQLLSLFFPAYSLQSKLTRDAVLGSIETSLKLSMDTKSFPFIKLVEYVCEIVAIAEEADEMEENQEAETEQNSLMAIKVASQIAPFILHVLDQEEKVGKKIITLTALRGLCKLLGSLEVDGPTRDLIRLREILEELGMILTDPTCLRALQTLTEDLVDVEIEAFDEAPSPISKGRGSSASTVSENTDVIDKENSGVVKTLNKSRISTDSTLSIASSRVTRSSLKSSTRVNTVG